MGKKKSTKSYQCTVHTTKSKLSNARNQIFIKHFYVRLIMATSKQRPLYDSTEGKIV